MIPFLWSRSSKRFRFSSSRSRPLPGWMDEGALGRTASVADSAQDSSSAGRPKYRQAAASRPTTFPPKGAWEAYRARISSLDRRDSSRVARTASTPFCQSVLSFPRDIRTTCIVIVLPPLTTCPWLMLLQSARTSARGSTPGCHRKCLSSNWMRAVAYRSGTVSQGGNRHCPSDAMRAPRSSPLRSVTTVA